ncbi:sugar ABC transporter substrate-binding protein [Leifsonia sp. ZF2019]|uniref:ABC transporter substrate-binding protein n=1 Tax=Leifsonia sp. ZF2019 TaxID=2781978 RepID=UPI001CC121BA|nr:sugar ABC transporter substrate-binding protein [Leifsonia sp. ZF2019]UAJ80005.1 sugar ABC transporter substrate-binding protein [Leifsonia sp. ZF2019]
MTRFPRSGRRALGAALAAAVALAGLTACGSDERTSAPADGGGLGTAEKHVAITMMSNDAFAQQWQEQLVPEFNKKYPYVDVTIDAVPYTELLAKGMLNGTDTDPQYDLITLDDPWTPQLAQAGVLLDLTKDAAPWTEKGYDWSDFNSAPLAASEWDGKQYGVPLRSNMLLMFYNKDLYAKAGVPEPTPDLTWSEYMKQAPRLVQDTDGDGKPDSWAVGLTWMKGVLSPPFWQAVLNSNGGKLFTDEMKPAFDTAAGAAALQTQVDLLKYAPPGAESYNYTEPLDAFRQGKIATIFTWGSAYKSAAVDPAVTTLTPEQVGIQTMPAGSAGPSTHRGIWSGAVFKNSAHPEAAWTFLQWMSSRDGERFCTDTFGSFPARSSTLASTPAQPWMRPVFDTLQSAYDVAAKGEMWRPRSPESNAIQEVLADQTSAAVLGGISSSDALGKAKTQIEELLK